MSHAVESPAMAKALQLQMDGDPAGAARLYEEIVAADPGAATAWHFLGIAFNQLGRHEPAIEALRRSLERQPHNASWWNNLGNILHGQKKHEEAVAAFQRGLKEKPDDDTIWANLGAVHQWQKRYEEAETAYRRAVTLHPGNFEALKLLANLMIIVDRVEEAAAIYGQWLEKRPGDPIVAHLYAACSRRNVPEKCSASYVETTFDAFAAIFEQRLQGLSYRGPQMMEEALRRHAAPGGAAEALDACCGTGLCGPVLKPFARKMTGVDLSQEMLAHARKRNLYDALVKEELQAYLLSQPDRFDLILCADALIYFGNIAPLFAAVCDSLRPGGLFLFTIETAPDNPQGYTLNTTGRFSHSRAYIERLAAEKGFSLIEAVAAPVRMELNQPVAGLAFVLKKES